MKSGGVVSRVVLVTGATRPDHQNEHTPMSSVPDAAVAASYVLPPLSRATAEPHLRRAKHALFRLCESLRTLAEHAAHFAANPNPRLPGSPDLSEVRADLRMYYDLARLAAVDTGRFRHEGRDQWELFAPFALLRSGGERPPHSVDGVPYTFQAVIRLATRVQTIGWNEPGRLRVAGDPWYHETPAERLRDAGHWRLPPDPPLPYFGDKAVYDEFVAALTREFDKAEEALARLPADPPNRTQKGMPGVADGLHVAAKSVGQTGPLRESLAAASRLQPAEETEAAMPPRPASARSGAAVAAVLELVREFREGLGLLEVVQQADAARFPAACRGWLGWLDRAAVRLVRSAGGGEDSLGSPRLRELYREEVRRHPVCPRVAGFAAVRELLGEGAERQVRELATRGADLRPSPDAGPEQLTRSAGVPERSIRIVLQWYRETINQLESELLARGLWAPEGQGILGPDPSTASSAGPSVASGGFSCQVLGGGVGVEGERMPPPVPPSGGGPPVVPLPVRSWLQARYLSDPCPDAVQLHPDRRPEPVVFIPYDLFADFLTDGGHPLLPILDACRTAGLTEDIRLDTFEPEDSSHRPTPWIARCVERLQLAAGLQHRLVAIRRNVLTLPTTAGERLSPASPPAAHPAARPEVAKKTKGKNVEARMLKLIADKPHEVVGWSLRQWAEALGCAESTVCDTDTWKTKLMSAKALERVDRVQKKPRKRGRKAG